MASEMTTFPDLPDSPVEGRVVTTAERRLAVEHWLLMATDDWQRARQEWRQDGVALLRCGDKFCAIRVPLDVAEAAAGCAVPAEVDAYLSGALPGAPVIRSQLGKWLFVLCEASTVTAWTAPGTEYLGDGHQLGVPHPDIVRHPGGTGAYWAVPMSGPGVLGNGATLSRLISHGRRRLAQMAMEPPHTPVESARVDLAGARQLWDHILHLTRDLPATVPPRAQIDPSIATMRDYLEDLVRSVEPALDEKDPAIRPTARWLLGRVRQLLLSEPPSSPREAAEQAENLALSYRALGGIYEKAAWTRRGTRP